MGLRILFHGGQLGELVLLLLQLLVLGSVVRRIGLRLVVRPRSSPTTILLVLSLGLGLLRIN